MSVRKIAILGGGVGSMAAAWELTRSPGWREEYEITVYQMGWRLGGKGASGRNMEAHGRIQEHGLHMWMGFYENAFEVMREVYEYCLEKGLMPGSPFRTYKDAFSPINVVSSVETVRGKAMPWTVIFPETESWPGEDNGNPGVTDHGSLVWFYVVRMLELLVAEFDNAVAGGICKVGWLPASWWSKASRRLATPLHAALRTAQRLPQDPAHHSAAGRDAVAAIIDGFGSILLRAIDIASAVFKMNPALRRLGILLDTVLAVVRGVIRDDIIERGFSHIDSIEFSDWLKSHGCHNPKSPITDAFYDACFAYVDGSGKASQQNMAAGTMLNGLLRLTLGYNKSIMLAMNAGMGDTIFAPLYLALKDRGVNFEFFHKVTGLSLSEDHACIDRISIDVQAKPREPYRPLIQVTGVYSWLCEPLWDQLADAGDIRRTPVNHDLESAWCACATAASKVLQRGVDFDFVVNGISLGALPFISKELADANPAWSRMIAQVQLVRTQAFQLWLNVPTRRLGWDPGPQGAGIVTGFVEPFDTWADMTRLIDLEDFAPGSCKGIAYFCNCLEDDGPPAPFSDPSYPGVQTARVRKHAQRFLDRDIAKLWPTAVDQNGFNTHLLAAGDSLDNQYFRANVEPSELYVLSTAGTIDARLAPGQSGFRNLFLAGDWTRVELNIGCVEAAVQSGKMAANAVSGSPDSIRGPFGIRLPIRGGSLI